MWAGLTLASHSSSWSLIAGGERALQRAQRLIHLPGRRRLGPRCRPGIEEQVLSRNVERFRGGLVFQAHRLLYHSLASHTEGENSTRNASYTFMDGAGMSLAVGQARTLILKS